MGWIDIKSYGTSGQHADTNCLNISKIHLFVYAKSQWPIEILQKNLTNQMFNLTKLAWWETSGKIWDIFWRLLDQDIKLCFRGNIVKNREEQERFVNRL